MEVPPAFLNFLKWGHTRRVRIGLESGTASWLVLCEVAVPGGAPIFKPLLDKAQTGARNYHRPRGFFELRDFSALPVQL
jgi:hypothetical protein